MRYRAVHLGLEYLIFQTSTTAVIVRELGEGNDASLTYYVLLTLLECQIYFLNAYVCFCLCVVVVFFVEVYNLFVLLCRQKRS